MSDVMSHLNYWSKTAPSEVGLRVARLMDEWGGLHHFDAAAMKKVEWSNPLYITVTLDRGHTTSQLSTFDFNGLTALVFLAHDHCIRVDVQPCNPQKLRLMFHPRNAREGGMSTRHPTLETAVAEWRARGHVDTLKPPEAQEVEKGTVAHV